MNNAVAIVCDDNYAPYSSCLLISLFENNPTLTFDVFLLTCKFTDENKNIIDKICRNYGSNVSFIEIDESKLNLYEGIGDWSKYTFMKLMIPSVLPNYLERVLYLDIDMLVVSSINFLLSVDITGFAVAGVEDCPDCIKHKKKCGIQNEFPYINSGVMVINLPMWRNAIENDSFGKFINLHKGLFKINDQDVINTVFQGKIKSLHLKYNLTNHCYGLHYNVLDSQKNEWKEARKNPVIIHFTNWNKPWKYESVHEFRKQYLSTLAKTPYRLVFKDKNRIRKVKNQIKYLFVSIIDKIRLK